MSFVRQIGLGVLAGMLGLSMPVTGLAQGLEPQHEHGEEISEPEAPRRTAPWAPEIVELFASVPVQSDGRIKPMSTYASFLLLDLNEVRSATTPSGERLTPTEWLLDCLFFPDQASHYKTFVVTDRDILTTIGLDEIARKKRDRYTYSELLPGARQLYELADRYKPIDPKKRSLMQQQTIDLYHKVDTFYALGTYLTFARVRIPLHPQGIVSQMIGGQTEMAYSDVLERAPSLGRAAKGLQSEQRPESISRENAKIAAEEIDTLLKNFRGHGDFSWGLAVFPPESGAKSDSPWWTPVDIGRNVGEGRVVVGHAEICRAFEGMVESLGDDAAFLDYTRQLNEKTAELAGARGEYQKIPMEVSFYKADLFFKAQWMYVLTFLLAAVALLLPRSRVLKYLTPTLLASATAVVIAGIVWRCILRSRPPVSTLYETILFITAVGVLTCMVIQLVNRKRLLTPVGAFLGAAGMFLAYRYELSGSDTMPRLLAVLDTNFWLSTHVTIVTAGYAGGLLAGILAAVYILGRLFRVRQGDRDGYRGLARMTYGVICFSLICSVVGTILGGIWANYSWGRFWGWDPKENGALMICLWQISMLHGRMGGYLRDLGIAVTSVLGAAVVVFSWWGVNMLGVGLHAYGFTEGKTSVYIAYGVIGLIALAGVGLHFRDGGQVAAADPAPAPEPGGDAPAPDPVSS